MAVSKRVRAEAIEALLNVASEYQAGSDSYIAVFTIGAPWNLAMSAHRIVRQANGWAKADADTFGAAASLLDAGWEP